MAVAKVKLPLAVMVRLSPPLSCKTKPVPVRPVIVPPMVKVEDDVWPPEPELLDVLGEPVQPNMTDMPSMATNDLAKEFIVIVLFMRQI